MLTGGCYCGRISLEMTAPPETVAYCHCRDCRRITGAPVAAFAAFPAGAVKTVPPVTPSSAFDGVWRQFCPQCGSALTAVFDYLPGQTYVPVGVLDDADAFPPAMHAHADSCLSWLKIEDDLPRSSSSARADLNPKATP